MNSPINLEDALRAATQPQPHSSLLTRLERDIVLPSPSPAPTRRGWRAVLLPLSAVAGVSLLAALAVFSLNIASVCSLAASAQALKNIRTVKITSRARSGTLHAVMMDPSKGTNSWPNYSTSLHPANDFEVTENWLELVPGQPLRTRARASWPGGETWRAGGWELTVRGDTGARVFRLKNQPFQVASVASYLADPCSIGLQESLSPVESIHSSTNQTIWWGQTDYVSFADEQVRFRFAMDKQTDLPLLWQKLNKGFPGYPEEFVMMEQEFSNYNDPIPQELLNFQVTDADLAPLGLTRAELDQLSTNCFSVHLTGTTGQELRVEMHDDAGPRSLTGKLPFAFIVEQHGLWKMHARFTDGQAHDIGLTWNDTGMNSVGRGLVLEQFSDRVETRTE